MPGIVAKSTASGVLFASRINDRFNPMKPIKFNLTILIVGSTLLLAGCSDNWCWPFDCESSSSGVETPDTVATTATANPVTETQTTNAVAETDTASTVATGTTATDFDLSRATFLHTDVSGWSQTTTLSVELSANQICLYYDKTNSWPSSQLTILQVPGKSMSTPIPGSSLTAAGNGTGERSNGLSWVTSAEASRPLTVTTSNGHP